MMSRMQNFIIIGAGGHSRVIIDVLKWESIRGIIDINYCEESSKAPILNVPILGGIEVLDKCHPFGTKVVIAIGDNKTRQRYYEIVKEKGFSLPTIIHETAIISKRVKIGNGTFINAGAIINACCEIGNNVIINTGAIVDHECKIADHSHICPGVKLAGKVTIGEGCFICIGASIIPNVSIGNRSTVGAGAVVIRNVENDYIVAGVPAKTIT
jgi:UDP-perosamine 4-acetyltransferase